MKLVWPATLTLSLVGELGSRPSRRKVTFRIMFSLSLCGDSTSLGFSFSFPFSVLPNTASSSTMPGVTGNFLDRVAVRRPCSSVDRNLWKVFDDVSMMAGRDDPTEVGGLKALEVCTTNPPWLVIRTERRNIIITAS